MFYFINVLIWESIHKVKDRLTFLMITINTTRTTGSNNVFVYLKGVWNSKSVSLEKNVISNETANHEPSEF